MGQILKRRRQASSVIRFDAGRHLKRPVEYWIGDEMSGVSLDPQPSDPEGLTFFFFFFWSCCLWEVVDFLMAESSNWNCFPNRSLGAERTLGSCVTSQCFQFLPYISVTPDVEFEGRLRLPKVFLIVLFSQECQVCAVQCSFILQADYICIPNKWHHSATSKGLLAPCGCILSSGWMNL